MTVQLYSENSANRTEFEILTLEYNTLQYDDGI